MMTQITNNRRGATTVMVLVAMTAICGLAALAIDLATVEVAKKQMQTAADAAALAGAGRMRAGAHPVAARLAAQTTAEANTILGDGATLNAGADVTIGDYDVQTDTVSSTWSEEELPVVEVIVRRTEDSPDGALALSFSSLLGIGSVNVQARAVAAVGSMEGFGGRPPLEVVIVQDGSLSFVDEIPYAKQADSGLVDLVTDSAVDGDRVALVNFAGSGWRERDFGDLPDDQSSINSAIASGDYCSSSTQMQEDPDRYSGTNTGDGLDEAVAIFSEQGTSAAEQVIVLVSDGMPYPEARRPLAVEAADRAAAVGIRIHTVTFDQEGGGQYGIEGADAEFNASLVRNGGYSFHTPDTQGLSPILNEIGVIEIGRPRLIR